MQRRISREELDEQLRLNPDITQEQLKAHFKCGTGTLRREMKRHGLATKPCTERDYWWAKGDRSYLRRWHKEHPEFGENQRGAANPIHKVRHLYDDPEYVWKITRGIREHIRNKTGKSYEEVYGETRAEEYKEKLRQASPVRMAKFKRKVTAPELAIRELLVKLGVEFHEQYPVGYCTVDFFIPRYCLIVQADGDYWHGNERLYPVLSERQLDRRRLDAAADAYATNRGMRVLRLWESELKHDCDACEVAILAALQRNEND